MTGPGRSAAVVRGGAAAGVATLVALASHVLAGGQSPGLLGIVFPLLVAFSVCTAFAGLRRSWLRLSVSVIISQSLFHTFFVIGASTPTTALSSPLNTSHGGHELVAPMMSESVAIPHALHTSGSMWMAHVVAAALTIVALHGGEAALSRLCELAARVTRLPRVEVTHVLIAACSRKLVARPQPDDALLRPTSVIASLDVRRGPPAAIAPAL